MNKKTIAASLTGLSVFLAGLTALCTHTRNNPFDSNYKGSYAFDVVWDSLPAAPRANAVYKIPFTASAGNDYFSDIAVSSTPEGFIDAGFTDSAIAADGYFANGKLAAAGELKIRFATVDSGKVYVTVTSPNGKTVITDSARVKVAGILTCGADDHTVAFDRDVDSIDAAAGGRVSVRALGNAARYVWRFSDDDTVITTLAGYLDVSRTSSAPFTVYVYAIDSCDNAGAEDSMVVVPAEYAYHIDVGVFPDTVFLGREYAWTAAVRETGFSGKLYWTIDSAGVVRSDSGVSPDTIFLTFNDSVSLRITVQARDAQGRRSVAYERRVMTRTHRPVAAFTRTGNYECLINTAVSCTVRVSDAAGEATVDSLYWKLDGGAFVSTAPSIKVWTHTFTEPGAHKLSVYALDEEGFASETVSVDIIVRSEIPVVSGLQGLDTVSVYMGQLVTLVMDTATATTGGAITAYYWDFDGDTAAWDTTTGVNALGHSFGTAGVHTVWLKVKDAFDKYSLADTAVVVVLSGGPELGAIKLDVAANQLFVAKTRRYGFSVSDPFGALSKLYFDVNGINVTQYNVAALNVSSLDTAFYYAFHRDSAGSATVRIRAEDNSGQFDTAALAVSVRRGVPVVDSLAYSRPDSLFVNDTRAFRIYGHDTNSTGGFTFYYDMDKDDEWDGSSSDGQFNYAFPVDKYGAVTVRLGVMDEDSVVGTAEKVVNVRLGAPVVWGDDGDTVWVVVDKGYSGAGVKYYAKIHARDTNGTIQKYYWSNNPWPDSGTVTPGDSLEYEVNIGTLHIGIPKYIHVRDDDGLVRGGRFVVFADSAPRAITAAYSDAQHKFSWSGLDAKDSLSTEYRILVKKGGAPDTSANSTDVAKDWTPGSVFGYTEPAYQGGPTFFWTYTPSQGNGKYFYQIIARDKRGTKSYSSNALNFDY